MVWNRASFGLKQSLFWFGIEPSLPSKRASFGEEKSLKQTLRQAHFRPKRGSNDFQNEVTLNVTLDVTLEVTLNVTLNVTLKPLTNSKKFRIFAA